jgi:predicted ATP-binding protein involved in virulence
MYIKNVILENYGPYKNINLNFSFDGENNPKPMILIGKNGSGKTILLSHIVNALITGQQLVYNNGEVEKGKVYKYRSPNYINSEANVNYSFSKVEFTESEVSVTEWQLRNTRKEIEKTEGFTQPKEEWQRIPQDEFSYFNSSFTKDSAGDLILKQCVLYFPSNRFEEPGWLNIDNLIKPVKYQELKNIQGYSNRSIVSISSLKDCQRWLLDVLLDRNILEIQQHNVQQQFIGLNKNNGNLQSNMVNLPIFGGFQGQANNIYNEIINLLHALLGKKQKKEVLRFGIGSRRDRRISIVKDERELIPNLFQLSSGETLLFDLFLGIIRDFDLCETPFNKLSDIKGIVLVDEVDSHLHGKLQKEILPSLLKLFPKVQFILTTHSPMFLLGMEQTFGTNGYDIIEMPSASPVSIEGFSEFTDLFATISKTKTYQDSIKLEIEKSQQPIVFVEGDYDIRYLTKTIELFYPDQLLLERFRFADGEGYGNLDNIWKSMSNKVSNVLAVRTLLLYDCDVQKKPDNKGKISKVTIPTNTDNPIEKGIENLLSQETIKKLENENSQFIDITPATKKRIRGEMITIPEKQEINKDEKKNICDWLCQKGTENDFEGFRKAIDIIIDFLRDNENILTPL